ncbi:hypothetical protein INR79_09105 [Vibrio sp. SCSIO 43132]|uniref:hypothetical protein n=1 Tax=Vibrio sp. SCSIO 43132 TaxID=2779363 RepID=UPI001CA98D43|nr:hypothetical protein [Vibrio sp. SCSIO 43132]UAB68710.1 hypothetical protein INR79_09105 [Vibrio sp. SCSIO 43132]
MALERVYALCGTSNAGKTSCLNALIEILTKKAEKTIPIKDADEDEDDRIAIFLINGKYVGVSTQGDVVKQVQDNLNAIESAIESQCNIIFCATRTRGGKCTHVIDRFGEKLTWIECMGIYNHKAYAFDNSAFIKAKTESLANLMFSLVG